MQMEDNTADELNGKLADLVLRITLFANSMEKDANTRVRQLFIEALGAQVTAMENCINAMTLMIIQAKDAGFVECNRQIRETLRNMNTVTAGPFGLMSDTDSIYTMLNEDKLRARTASLEVPPDLDVTFALTPGDAQVRNLTGKAVTEHLIKRAEAFGFARGGYIKLDVHAPAVPTGVSEASVTGADEVAGLVNTEGVRIEQDDPNPYDPNGRAIDELAHAVADEGYVIHKLKIWPQWFEDVSSELKTFEVRLNDRGFKTGDYLDLREFNSDTNEYTGRRVLREISYCVDLAPIGLAGHVALGIAKVKPVNG